jgi:polyketide cyclase/dehydrase/lipid transport protein
VTGVRQRLTGSISVALPPGEAFRLFTPRGEEDWAHGWHPRFPAPAADDTEPGTVFTTSAHGRETVWVVTGRERGRRVSYARVAGGATAGTITVTLTQTSAGTEAEVTYDLTALTDRAAGELREFSDGYSAFLRSWQDDIGRISGV